MNTATTEPTTSRRPKVACRECQDTGVVTRQQPKLIGHDSAGRPVYGRPVPANYACACRHGWPKGGTR